jgi:hypothetical protein
MVGFGRFKSFVLTMLDMILSPFFDSLLQAPTKLGNFFRTKIFFSLFDEKTLIKMSSLSRSVERNLINVDY